MALFHFTVTQTKRSKGQSAIASAAYRSGEKLYSEYYGEYSDYTRKGGVICSDILLPPHALKEYADRQTLWNAVEKAERGKNAQLAYSFEISLQNEFSLEENIALAREFLLENFVSRGMVVDFAVHQPDREDGGIPNPHFHVLCPMGIVFICAWQTLNGQMSLAYFLMFVLFSFVIFGSVENINDAAHMLGLIDSAMNKLESLENAEYIDQDGKDITPASYDITFQDVSFGYDKRTVLHDVNFTIPQNTTTAIVGPSGSGKSTLCSLIARFYDVDAGKITFGGTDIREFTCDSLLKNISMVFQNVYLFRDTIRNNIKFGSPDASEEQIIAAAKKARCHDFIMALPDGYDTVIGEGGSSLSGGEKQRISIARAMLKDAPIVILDEATASIDPENEHLIQEAISALTHGKTIITIAHRLATIENADQILVIDGGTVVQKGTHKELLKQRGTYQDFIRIREQAEGWRIQQ